MAWKNIGPTIMYEINFEILYALVLSRDVGVGYVGVSTWVGRFSEAHVFIASGVWFFGLSKTKQNRTNHIFSVFWAQTQQWYLKPETGRNTGRVCQKLTTVTKLKPKPPATSTQPNNFASQNLLWYSRTDKPKLPTAAKVKAKPPTASYPSTFASQNSVR